MITLFALLFEVLTVTFPKVWTLSSCHTTLVYAQILPDNKACYAALGIGYKIVVGIINNYYKCEESRNEHHDRGTFNYLFNMHPKSYFSLTIENTKYSSSTI